MRVAFFQLSPAFGEKAANLDRVEEAVRRLKAELVVLPELFTTGYQFTSAEEVRSLAEEIPAGETVTRLGRMVRETGMAFAGGLLEREGEAIYNSAVLLLPGADGVTVGLYRKMHLFVDEKRWMRPGNLGFPVFTFRGWRLGLLICFDWVFPEATRALALQGMDLLLHPSNLVLPYCQDAMRTRALENGIFAVTANRVGVEERTGPVGRLAFTGMSQVVGPRGEVIVRASRDEELRVVEIDLEAARGKQITATNHLLLDRRPEWYRGLVEETGAAGETPPAARS